MTLYPLFQPDVLPFRSLTFAPDTESVKIGRASKREAKGLVPAHHNALFESRVMSRDHAQLRVSFEKKVGVSRQPHLVASMAAHMQHCSY